MSKVGIMSMQRIKNYGSFLQAYALKKIIEELGHQVEFVDYHIGEPITNKSNSNKVVIKLKKCFKILQGKVKLKHKIQFLRHKKLFSKKYNKFLKITNFYNYNPKLDTLVIGSDEVFNCIQSNPNVGYSLELFGKDNKASKVITYAASFGNATLEKLKKLKKDKEIAYYLKKINEISVRDNNSGNIVSKLIDKKIYHHLDPALIYNYLGDNNFDVKLDSNEKYIIIYAYNDRLTEEEALVIKKYANKNKCKIYCIGGIQSFADKFIDCSPFELLSYFKNAYAIITDTFHGTIFSIIAEKNFATIIRKSNNFKYGNEEKLKDLLKKFNLIDREICKLSDLNSIITKDIDYSKIKKIILEERKKTYEYLSTNI